MKAIRLICTLFALILALGLSICWRNMRPTGSVLHQAVKPSAEVSALSKPDAATQARVSESYGKLPLGFEANQGQTAGQAKFLSRGSGYQLSLMTTGAVLTLRKAEGGRRKDELKRAADSSFIPHPSSFATLRMNLV